MEPLCSVDELGKDRSWIEIDARAVLKNLQFFRKTLDRDFGASSTRMGCVLKGNAYGHGLEAMCKVLSLPECAELVDVFYVFSVADALRMRRFWECESLESASRRIVILGAHPQPFLSHTDGRNVNAFEWVISSFYQISKLQELAEDLAQIQGKILVHLHVDTGLGREGFSESDCARAAELLAEIPGVSICGFMTHFANTEDVTRQDYAFKQIASFERSHQSVLKQLAELGEKGATDQKTTAQKETKLERHLAASAASLVLGAAHADIVRIGIGLYGIWPSNETRLGFLMENRAEHFESALNPVLSWRVLSLCIKKLDQGHFVGYGCSFRCVRDTIIAVFPVGYYDGFVRSLTSVAYVLVRGKRCPVIGRVMMNHIVVDVSICVGAEELSAQVCATLIGVDGEESISADDHASWSGTISYEVVTRIHPSLERVIKGVDEGFRLRSS